MPAEQERYIPMLGAIRATLAIRGVATASLLGILASVILMKPNITYQTGVLWWIAFVLAAALLIEFSIEDRSVLQILGICLLPTACLFAGLVFRLGLQILLFSAKAAPLVILGSGISTIANLNAELHEVSGDIGSVDWAVRQLN